LSRTGSRARSSFSLFGLQAWFCSSVLSSMRLATYIAFSNRMKAEAFERYLKSGSGHAFAKKRLW